MSHFTWNLWDSACKHKMLPDRGSKFKVDQIHAISSESCLWTTHQIGRLQGDRLLFTPCWQTTAIKNIVFLCAVNHGVWMFCSAEIDWILSSSNIKMHQSNNATGLLISVISDHRFCMTLSRPHHLIKIIKCILHSVHQLIILTLYKP